MGQIVMIIGESGSGKSTSLRNFKKSDNVGVLNVLGKRMPYKGSGDNIMNCNNPDYPTIYKTLKENNLDTYIIDDSTYLMQLENFRRVQESGFNKFTEMATHFANLLDIAKNTDDDTIVYFLHHFDFQGQSERKAPQTIGKMLDNQLNILGMFPIVIECLIDENGEHKFKTASTSSSDIVKTPIGMFEDVYIDNDLSLVDQAIRDYWNINKKSIKGGE